MGEEGEAVSRGDRERHPRPGWESDRVVTAEGVIIPVRATAQRPSWSDLPLDLRSLIETELGAAVVDSVSAGTGFTPGFASRLDLANGRQVFVKAASTADDEVNGWPLSDAYRDEARKLAALPAGIGAPTLLWHQGVEVDGLHWIVLAFEFVAGVPPRRPWQPRELRLVLDKLAATASALSEIPSGLELGRAEDEIVGRLAPRLERIHELGYDREWVQVVATLCDRAGGALSGDSIVHLDLRDDNVLIGDAGDVWFVDWNWPALGAPWIDVVCILISAFGDGLDAEAALADHPLTRAVDPAAIDSLLAVLWSFWAVGRHQDVPVNSPHLRNHQSWYADVTQAWLTARVASRASNVRP